MTELFFTEKRFLFCSVQVTLISTSRCRNLCPKRFHRNSSLLRFSCTKSWTKTRHKLSRLKRLWFVFASERREFAAENYSQADSRPTEYVAQTLWCGFVNLKSLFVSHCCSLSNVSKVVLEASKVPDWLNLKQITHVNKNIVTNNSFLQNSFIWFYKLLINVWMSLSGVPFVFPFRFMCVN